MLKDLCSTLSQPNGSSGAQCDCKAWRMCELKKGAAAGFRCGFKAEANLCFHISGHRGFGADLRKGAASKRLGLGGGAA